MTLCALAGCGGAEEASQPIACWELPAEAPTATPTSTDENVTPTDAGPVTIAVMDPLAAPLCCACVDGVGQRDYARLGPLLEERLGRPVEFVFGESLHAICRRIDATPHFVIGQDSVVRFDGNSLAIPVSPLIALTDRTGRTHVRGVVVVRKEDVATEVEGLADHRIVLGPAENAETHSAARSLLPGASDERAIVETSIDAAVFRVTDGEADVTVVPDYLPPLLAGCGKIEPGSLRIVGRTEPVPFVRVFATDRTGDSLAATMTSALEAIDADAALLEALESRDGFVALDDERTETATKEQEEVAAEESTGDTNSKPAPASVEWTDWRGPGRRGVCETLPKSLPANPRRFWTVKLTGPAMAGIAATTERVLVADKSADRSRDVFLCLDARTGDEIWRLEYDAPGRVEYTNAPRATPVVHDGLVYLHGALGDLHCVKLADGEIVWRTNLLTQFGADPLTWGSSVPPLVVDDLLIVNPGAQEASLAALDRRTGEVVWKTPGHAAAYAPFIVGTFGGRRQIVGYDAAGLGAWDPKTGRRLWELIPPTNVDFHVGTPLDLGGRLLVATENNATRLYAFADDGTIRPEPAFVNEDLAPDSPTPVVWKGRLFCTAFGALYELDLEKNLETVWDRLDDLFYDHANLIAGNDRLLVWNTTGDLLLLRADAGRYEVVSHIRPFAGDEIETMSHPAIVGDRLYLRHEHELACLSLTENGGEAAPSNSERPASKRPNVARPKPARPNAEQPETPEARTDR